MNGKWETLRVGETSVFLAESSNSKVHCGIVEILDNLASTFSGKFALLKINL